MAMINMFSASALLFLAATITLLMVVMLHIRKDRLSKIDGPKGNIFVGLGLALPPYATQRLREWAQQYGEVYKIRIGWYNWVVLSSPEAIKEILDKQASDPSMRIDYKALLLTHLPRSQSRALQKCQRLWASWL
jgi:hypothetical protein